MAKYVQQAQQLGDQVNEFLNDLMDDIDQETIPTLTDREKYKRKLAQDLGYLLSKAIQCHTRPLQTTVRKNILEEAVGDYCLIQVKEETLPATDRYPTPKTIKKVLIRAIP